MKRRLAFSMIELLVVIVIIAIVLAIALPMLARARRLQRSTACLGHLRQIAQGFHQYADANKGFLPDELSEFSWDYLLERHLQNEAVFSCPADSEGFAEKLGTSYDWRDSFQVDPAVPEASLGGLRLDQVKDTTVAMVFELSPGWHDLGWINAASVDTSARAWRQEEFEANLSIKVRDRANIEF